MPPPLLQAGYKADAQGRCKKACKDPLCASCSDDGRQCYACVPASGALSVYLSTKSGGQCRLVSTRASGGGVPAARSGVSAPPTRLPKSAYPRAPASLPRAVHPPQLRVLWRRRPLRGLQRRLHRRRPRQLPPRLLQPAVHAVPGLRGALPAVRAGLSGRGRRVPAHPHMQRGLLRQVPARHR